ncbi:MAG: SBBP repeat-containing protein [Flavobacteriales bacterium]|nr:SBBP repeat-containing protein [Flavobacteriales bacterium]
MKTLVLIAAVCITQFSFSQIPTNSWVSEGGSALYREVGNAVVSDVFGNCYVVGSFQDTAVFGSFSLVSAGNVDLFIVKYDHNGNCIWAKSAGSASLDIASDITIDDDGNLYVVGYYSQNINFDNISKSSSGEVDAFIAKIDQNGNYQWIETINGPVDVWSYAVYFNTMNKNVYLAGDYGVSLTCGNSNLGLISTGGYEGYLASIDKQGNFTWIKNLGAPNSDQFVKDMTIDNNGSIYVYGDFQDNIDFGTGITLTTDIKPDKVPFLVKFDLSGAAQWAKKIERSSQSNINGFTRSTDITIDNLDNVLITGYSAQGIVIDSTDVLHQSGDHGVYVVKIDDSGQVVWGNMASGTGFYWGNSVATDSLNNVYLTGRSDGLLDFSPYIFQSGNTFFIVQLSGANGNWTGLHVGQSSSTGEMEGHDMHIGTDGSVYVTGEYLGTVQLDNNGVNSQNILNTNAFLAKYSSIPTSIFTPNAQNELIVSPNPNNGSFKINTLQRPIIRNALGQEIPFDFNNGFVNVSNQNKGLIILEVPTKGHFEVRKVIVE